jgi:acetyl-CoA carboxylase, biotin carboxylase subunit
MMFAKVLVANRGAVAARVIRALREMRIGSVAVYSDADRDNPYVAEADEAHHIGPSPAKESYLNIERLLAVARESGADAVHPGYGFLSENAGFARQVEAAGIRFIGPRPDMIETMGHKTQARDLVRRYGMPMTAGSEVLPADPAVIAATAERVGYPVIVKPAAGGGGIGMIAALNPQELQSAVEKAASMAARAFGNGEVYIERLIDRPRHIEIQVLGDRTGKVRHLFERDCSIQRRHQKVIEEARAPGLAQDDADRLGTQIAETLTQIGYDNIGTVEMLMSADGEFHFLEMNTRLQVEHGVTEEITGIDLVKAQIGSAAGESLDQLLPSSIVPQGHAIQARVYAEDPKRFFPSPGRLDVFRPPAAGTVRVETGYKEGGDVTVFYDPLVAKVIALAPTRDAAIAKLAAALEEFEITGIKHNIPALLAVLRSAEFRAGSVHTGLLSTISMN